MTYPQPLPQRPHSQSLGPKSLVFVSLTMILALLMLDFDSLKRFLPSAQSISQKKDCNTIISDAAKLSRDQLVQLLTIPERGTKEQVRKVVSEPYCQLPALNVRSGVTAEREAYPLAFDPGTSLVILYEDNEYAGYRFNFE
ncbi:MAG: hypothetical protein AAF572_17585 [Cyanobacteria bacterium P01_B01_bin.77]